MDTSLPFLLLLVVSTTSSQLDKEKLATFLRTVLEDTNCVKTAAITVGVVFGDNSDEDFTFYSGQRDIEADLDVDEDTLFGIGSTTKAMTAIVTDKVLKDLGYTWDTPIVTFYPSLKLPTDSGHQSRTNKVTFRDLYSHTTCLRRSDFWWCAGPSSFDVTQMMDKLQYMKPLCPFRNKFDYNNLMYVTGAYIIEQLSGKTWDTLLNEMVLTPLGMTKTKATFDEAYQTGNTVKGYKAVNDEMVEIPYDADRIIDLVRAAGSVHSTAVDMNKYMRHILEEEEYYNNLFWDPTPVDAGRYYGVTTQLKPPIPATTHMNNYTISWFLGDYQDEEILIHGGDTFTTSTFITLSRTGKYGIYASSTGGDKARELNQLLTWYIQDLITGAEPWLDSTNICSFPDFWKNEEAQKEENTDGNQEEKEEKEGGVIQAGYTAADNSSELSQYVGTYSHKAYGDVNITYSEETGLFFTYHRMNCTMLRKDGPGSFSCRANVPFLPSDGRVPHPELRIEFHEGILRANMFENVDPSIYYEFSNTASRKTISYLVTLGLIFHYLNA